jgi:predicted lipid carrier protein YhbT/chorismate mutase
MYTHLPERFALARARAVIDGIDDGLLVLLAARRRVVRAVARLKPAAGVPPRDPPREQRVRERARVFAARLDLPPSTAQGLLDLAIGDACRQQGLAFDQGQGAATGNALIIDSIMPTPSLLPAMAPHLLRLLPPPRRIAPLLRVMPLRWQRGLLEAGMARVLAAPLRWVLELHQGRLCVTDAEPEASVRGSVTDLLLLAGRLEDADTLFFQRRLVLTGDTELGLTARNILERLPWESIPLGLRIALNRGARFARAARTAHRRENS